MRRLLLLAAIGWLAACAPATAPELDAAAEAWEAAPPITASSDEVAACQARGGEIRPVCMMGTPQCVVTYADAGQVCRDGDDCQGACRAETMAPTGGPATGRCQATSDPCGCFADVEDGRIDAALCVD